MKKVLEEALDILKSICPVEEPQEVLEPVDKALKAAQIAGMSRRVRLHEYAAGAALEQPEVGTNRVRPTHEPPVVPVRVVVTPESTPRLAPNPLVECGQCGYLHKSLDGCTRCAHTAKLGGEAVALRFRRG